MDEVKAGQQTVQNFLTGAREEWLELAEPKPDLVWQLDGVVLSGHGVIGGLTHRSDLDSCYVVDPETVAELIVPPRLVGQSRRDRLRAAFASIGVGTGAASQMRIQVDERESDELKGEVARIAGFLARMADEAGGRFDLDLFASVGKKRWFGLRGDEYASARLWDGYPSYACTYGIRLGE